ncbi:PREDICTED: filamin A-interacting protein 1-like [Eufriesea mexicana]|uniref:filamin A-interacting protein 1-like n=1 Tax=Eufriesea mexicana TaxID=516756 RepID=UPI00083C1C4E|nr:PREDICTED: filamin A-interacting protein 1-like [Eufriesea mexicana]
MDLDIEKIHNILIEANLPSSINELKNPTEEFIVNLINTFLKRFHIDVNAIDKPTMEQQDIMSYSEDSTIIGLINLHVAMVQICDRIYLKDLCITDITSPGSKKVRKQAKFLANFILYATNKESDIEDKISEIQNRAKILNDILEKKNETLKARNDKALHVAKQLSSKEKYIAEIQILQTRIEKNNKKYVDIMSRMTAAEEKKQQAVELYGTYKTQALKLSKTIGELQLEIVKTPEEYQMRLSELEQQQSAKVKERETMQEAFQDKKYLIEQQKNILTFIQEQLVKFTEIRDIHDQLKKIKVQEDNLRKQVDTLKADIVELEKKLEIQKNRHKEDEINEVHAQCEERLSSLRNLSAKLLSNKKSCKEKLEEMQIQYNEDCLKLNKMQSMTKKLEEEIIGLLRTYQDLYNNEISSEETLWKPWVIE